jgi:glycogen synthase
MEAMRLGTLPIVAPTGGLKDTVEAAWGKGGVPVCQLEVFGGFKAVQPCTRNGKRLHNYGKSGVFFFMGKSTNKMDHFQ